jgi:hypothetical protein
MMTSVSRFFIDHRARRSLENNLRNPKVPDFRQLLYFANPVESERLAGDRMELHASRRFKSESPMAMQCA